MEAGSFNKAAEKLYSSPPAVIKQINLLEKDLGVPLLVRTHRGLTLTSAGKSIYQDAKYIIQYCKDSVTRAKNAMQDSEKVIRIGTSPTTPAAFAPVRRAGTFARANLLRRFGSPPFGPKGNADSVGPVWGKADADAAGVEPLCRPAAG